MPLKFPTFNFLFHLATDITTLEHLGTSQMKPHLDQLLKLVLRGPSVRRVSFHIYRQTTLSNYCPQTIAYFFCTINPAQCTVLVIYQWEFAAALFQFEKKSVISFLVLDT